MSGQTGIPIGQSRVYSDDLPTLKRRLQAIFDGRHRLLLQIAKTFDQQAEIAGQFVHRNFRDAA